MALSKAVAAAFNDEEVQAYLGAKHDVTSKSTVKPKNSKERLLELKELLDQGLISRGEYNKKKGVVLSEIEGVKKIV